MKAFIINYNRLTLPKNMARWLFERGCEPIFIDNHSDYPPLLEYYDKCPFSVIYLKQNYGHKVFWDCELYKILKSNERYILTDPDLDLMGIPDDFLKVLNEGLNKYPRFNKCGFSLEIDDLPPTPEGDLIRTKVEPRYWRKALDPLYFNAPIDTTFALYREGANSYFHPALRTNRPYTAKHLPWYYYHLSELSEDEQYYYKTANGSASGKLRLVP
jgi:hypothetical protein